MTYHFMITQPFTDSEIVLSTEFRLQRLGQRVVCLFFQELSKGAARLDRLSMSIIRPR